MVEVKQQSSEKYEAKGRLASTTSSRAERSCFPLLVTSSNLLDFCTMSDSEQQPEVKPENVHVALKVSLQLLMLPMSSAASPQVAHTSFLSSRSLDPASLTFSSRSRSRSTPFHHPIALALAPALKELAQRRSKLTRSPRSRPRGTGRPSSPR